MKLNGNSKNSGTHLPQKITEKPETSEIIVNEIRSDRLGRTREKPKGLRTWQKVLLVIAAVILAFLAFTGIHFLATGHFFWEQPLTVPPAPTEPVETEKQGGSPEDGSGDPDATADPGVTEGPGEDGEIEEGDALVAERSDSATSVMKTARKDGVFTFLVAGVDQVSSSTDTILIVSFDTKNHRISATSIPRDTIVNNGYYHKRVNSVYAADGIDGMRAQIKNLLGFEVDYYAIVRLTAVEELVDAIGGVWFDVPEDMEYDAPDQNLFIHIKKGYQLLNGEDSVKVCRFRATYSGGDLQRINVQHDFLMAMAKQVLSLKSLPHVAELFEALETDRNVFTNLTSGNIAWLARQFMLCSSEDIVFQTAPLSGGDLINGVSYVSLNVYDWLDMVNGTISPYTGEVGVSDVNILSFGWGGRAIGATSGYIVGGEDSFYCQQCYSATGGAVNHHAPGEHVNLAPSGGTEDPGAEAEAGGEDGGSGPTIEAVYPGND